MRKLFGRGCNLDPPFKVGHSQGFLFIMLQAGIVGLPNVGKSTLFNALTKTRKAEAANYPFCTIDPNVGVVQVPYALTRTSGRNGGNLNPDSRGHRDG